MISLDKARKIVCSCCHSLGIERVPSLSAGRRVLAENINAPDSLPRFDHSSVDGYAVVSNDLVHAAPDAMVALHCVGESTAGHPNRSSLHTGKTIRIATGGVLPPGADAVVKEEECEVENDGKVRFSAPVPTGSHVRRRGSEFRKGAMVLRSGSLLLPSQIGILASFGYRTISVFRKPRVSILATGDELVDVGGDRGDGQVFVTSTYLLNCLVEADGGIPRVCEIAPDNKNVLPKYIRRAWNCDLLLITGGTSRGPHDFLQEVLEQMGVHMRVAGVRMRPGKPLLFGTRGKTLVFGLPGNPLSTYVTYHQLVRPVMATLGGTRRGQIPHVEAFLEEPYEKRDRRRHFVLGFLSAREGKLVVRTVGRQHSGTISLIPKANCLIVIPEEASRLRRGTLVTVETIPEQRTFISGGP